MNSDSNSSHERTMAYGLRALAEVKRHRTSAEPIAYELWYSHVSGQHRPLSRELKAKLDQGQLSERDIEELHVKHLSSLRICEAVDDVGNRARSEMQGVLGALKSTLGDMAEFDGDLREMTRRLDDSPIDGTLLRSVLGEVLSTTRAICNTNGALKARLEASEANISALQIALEATRGEALTDGLTGLFNRRAFDEQLASRFKTAVAGGAPLSLLMLDIDHFKAFNDKHGHPVGDQVIRLVGSSIKATLESADMPARYGGEEFAVISLGRNLGSAAAVAESIRRKIAGYEIVRQGTKTSLGRITVSVGAATLGRGDTPEGLLQRADQCLYAAKRTGRNRVEAT